jgi:hypothetical protein
MAGSIVPNLENMMILSDLRILKVKENYIIDQSSFASSRVNVAEFCPSVSQN